MAGSVKLLTPAGGSVTINAGDTASALSITLPATSDTITTNASTQTLTNKTLTNPVINGFTGDTSVVNIGSGQIYKDTSGNVGIGTSSPGAKLDIQNAGGVVGRAYNTSNNSDTYFETKNSYGDVYFGVGGASAYMYTASSIPLAFFTAGSERMRIDSSGNVGIGTSSPQFRVSANQNYGSAAPSVQVTPQFYAKGYAGSSQQYAGIGFAMYEHTNGYWGSGILARDDTGSYGAALSFYTSTGSSTPTPSERMRIDSSGRITMPLQPSFLAYSTGFSHVGSWVKQSQNYTNTNHNIGSNYNTTNGRFTAPISGRYVFYAGGWAASASNGERYAFCAQINGGAQNFISGSNYCITDSPLCSYYVCYNLSAGDYVELSIFSAVATTYGGSTHYAYFGGYLLG